MRIAMASTALITPFHCDFNTLFPPPPQPPTTSPPTTTPPTTTPQIDTGGSATKRLKRQTTTTGVTTPGLPTYYASHRAYECKSAQKYLVRILAKYKDPCNEYNCCN